jgi:hypothetical protein
MTTNRRNISLCLTKILCLGLLAVSFTPYRVEAADKTMQLSNPIRSLPAYEVAVAPLPNEMRPVAELRSKRANFERENKSRDTRLMADWVVDSGDNGNMPFVIVDKIDAKVFVFDADGRLRGAAPCLLGLARGDDSVPDIGNRKLSSIRPEERTTPAGRFVASLGYNFNKKDVLWVDYAGALSMHRIITTKERLQRMATPTPLDNRISYGCINIPTKFYESVVSPTFTGTRGIVYILPETRPKSEIFAKYYDVE